MRPKSILKKTANTAQRIAAFSVRQEEPLVILGMIIAFSGCVVLCAINPQLVGNITLQSLTSAAFAVFATIIYLLYMVISNILRLVLQYIDARQHRLVASNETLLLSDDDDDGPNVEISREAVISSMYLGGSGAFLSIPPLCMWSVLFLSFFLMN